MLVQALAEYADTRLFSQLKKNIGKKREFPFFSNFPAKAALSQQHPTRWRSRAGKRV